jgi:sulfite reductase beta subunit
MDTCNAPLTALTCPTHAIRIDKLENGRQTVRILEEKCVHCGSCALQCGAIEFGRPGTGRAVISVGGKGSNTGCGPALGKVVAVHLPLSPPSYAEIVAVVRRIIEAWVRTARGRERVRDWIARIGWEKFYEWTELSMPREALDGFRQHDTTLRSDVRFRW